MDPWPDPSTLSDRDLKSLIAKLHGDEMRVSYERRLLHGRIDLLRAECLARGQGRSLSTADLDQIAYALVLGPPRPSRTDRVRRILVHLRFRISALYRQAPSPAVVAELDPLAGVASARAVAEYARLLASSIADPEPCWLLLIDVDDFHALNDCHGRHACDDYLARLARALLVPLAEHYLARIGGDQFAGIARDLSMEAARELAETLRTAPASLGPPSASVSVGMTGWRPDSQELADAIRRADTALYFAKLAGGNRVHVFGIDDEPDVGVVAAL